MGTKIQINSLKALEQLLHANPEVEMEIRRSVLKEYERKHILPSVEARVKLLAATEADALLGNTDYYGKLTLKKKFRDQIKTLVQKECDKEVRAMVKELVKEFAVAANVKEIVDMLVSASVMNKAKEEVQKKVDAAFGN